MNTINPALSSAVASVTPNSNSLSASREDLRVAQDSATTESQGGSSTVTLSDQSTTAPNSDYADLASSQTVRERESVESRETEANQTTSSDVTYASNLQAQSNYYANQANTATELTDSAQTTEQPRSDNS